MPDIQTLLTLLKQKQLSPEFQQTEQDVNPVGPPRQELQREEPTTVQSMMGPPAPTADQATNSSDFMARALREFQQYKNPYEGQETPQEGSFLALKNKLRGR